MMEVAVERWPAGNHAAETTGGALMAIGPASPLRNWPMWMSTVTPGFLGEGPVISLGDARPAYTTERHARPRTSL